MFAHTRPCQRLRRGEDQDKLGCLVEEHAEDDGADGGDGPGSNLDHTSSGVLLLLNNGDWLRARRSRVAVRSARRTRSRAARSGTSGGRWSITLQLKLITGNIEARNALGERARSNELDVSASVEGVLLSVVLGALVLQLDGGDVALGDAGAEVWELVAHVAPIQGGDGVCWRAEVGLLGWVRGGGDCDRDVPGIVADCEGDGSAGCGELGWDLKGMVKGGLTQWELGADGNTSNRAAWGGVVMVGVPCAILWPEETNWAHLVLLRGTVLGNSTSCKGGQSRGVEGGREHFDVR